MKSENKIIVLGFAFLIVILSFNAKALTPINFSGDLYIYPGQSSTFNGYNITVTGNVVDMGNLTLTNSNLNVGGVVSVYQNAIFTLTNGNLSLSSKNPDFQTFQTSSTSISNSVVFIGAGGQVLSSGGSFNIQNVSISVPVTSCAYDSQPFLFNASNTLLQIINTTIQGENGCSRSDGSTGGIDSGGVLFLNNSQALIQNASFFNGVPGTANNVQEYYLIVCNLGPCSSSSKSTTVTGNLYPVIQSLNSVVDAYNVFIQNNYSTNYLWYNQEFVMPNNNYVSFVNNFISRFSNAVQASGSSVYLNNVTINQSSVQSAYGSTPIEPHSIINYVIGVVNSNLTIVNSTQSNIESNGNYNAGLSYVTSFSPFGTANYNAQVFSYTGSVQASNSNVYINNLSSLTGNGVGVLNLQNSNIEQLSNIIVNASLNGSGGLVSALNAPNSFIGYMSNNSFNGGVTGNPVINNSFNDNYSFINGMPLFNNPAFDSGSSSTIIDPGIGQQATGFMSSSPATITENTNSHTAFVNDVINGFQTLGNSYTNQPNTNSSPFTITSGSTNPNFNIAFINTVLNSYNQNVSLSNQNAYFQNVTLNNTKLLLDGNTNITFYNQTINNTIYSSNLNDYITLNGVANFTSNANYQATPGLNIIVQRFYPAFAVNTTGALLPNVFYNITNSNGLYSNGYFDSNAYANPAITFKEDAYPYLTTLFNFTAYPNVNFTTSLTEYNNTNLEEFLNSTSNQTITSDGFNVNNFVDGSSNVGVALVNNNISNSNTNITYMVMENYANSCPTIVNLLSTITGYPTSNFTCYDFETVFISNGVGESYSYQPPVNLTLNNGLTNPYLKNLNQTPLQNYSLSLLSNTPIPQSTVVPYIPPYYNNTDFGGFNSSNYSLISLNQYVVANNSQIGNAVVGQHVAFKMLVSVLVPSTTVNVFTSGDAQPTTSVYNIGGVLIPNSGTDSQVAFTGTQTYSPYSVYYYTPAPLQQNYPFVQMSNVQSNITTQWFNSVLQVQNPAVEPYANVTLQPPSCPSNFNCSVNNNSALVIPALAPNQTVNVTWNATANDISILNYSNSQGLYYYNNLSAWNNTIPLTNILSWVSFPNESSIMLGSQNFYINSSTGFQKATPTTECPTMTNFTIDSSNWSVCYNTFPDGQVSGYDYIIPHFSNTTVSAVALVDPYNSTINYSVVDVYSNVSSSTVNYSNVNYSSINYSTVLNSTVLNSTLYYAFLFNSSVTLSNVSNSTLNNSVSINSTLNNSVSVNSTLNSDVLLNSSVTLSNVSNSTLNSDVLLNSNVNNSNFNYSTILNSNVSSLNTNNSIIINSTVLNSTIPVNANVQNANVSNGYLYSGTIVFNGVTYNGNTSLTAIINNYTSNTLKPYVYSFTVPTLEAGSDYNFSTQVDARGQTLQNVTLQLYYSNLTTQTFAMNGNLSNNYVSTFYYDAPILDVLQNPQQAVITALIVNGSSGVNSNVFNVVSTPNYLNITTQNITTPNTENITLKLYNINGLESPDKPLQANLSLNGVVLQNWNLTSTSNGTTIQYYFPSYTPPNTYTVTGYYNSTITSTQNFTVLPSYAFITPAQSSNIVQAGGLISYNITVASNGNENNNGITVNASVPWVTVTPSPFNLMVNGSQTLNVTINASSVPAGVYNVTVNFTSPNYNTTMNLTINTELNAVADLQLNPTYNATTILGGNATIVNYTLTNVGGLNASNVQCSLTQTPSWVTVNTQTFNLSSFQNQVIQLNVAPPKETPGGYYTATLNCLSPNTNLAQSQLIISVLNPSFILSPTAISLTLQPGFTTLTSFNLQNLGTMQANSTTCTAVSGSPNGFEQQWVTITPSTPFNLTQNSIQTVFLSIKVPSTASPGVHTINIQCGDPVTIPLYLNIVGGLSVSGSPPNGGALNTQPVTTITVSPTALNQTVALNTVYTAIETVSNIGNQPVSVTIIPSEPWLNASPSFFKLASGETQNVTITANGFTAVNSTASLDFKATSDVGGLSEVIVPVNLKPYLKPSVYVQTRQQTNVNIALIVGVLFLIATLLSYLKYKFNILTIILLITGVVFMLISLGGIALWTIKTRRLF